MKNVAILFPLLFCLTCVAQLTLRNGTFVMINAPAASHVSDGYESNLWAYFKAEENGAATTAVDEVAGNNMPISGGPCVTTNGIIGNAWNMDTFRWRRSTGTRYAFVDTNFSMRLWFKPDTNNYGATVMDNNGYDLVLNSGHTLRWKVYYNSGSVTATSPAIPSDTNWHRVVCWLSVSNEIGIKIDTNSATTTAVTQSMYNGGTDFLEFNATPSAFFQGVDELAFWNGFCLTNSSDLDLDWKNGAGQTYPLP